MTREMANTQSPVMGLQSVVVIWMRSDYELMPDDGLLEVDFCVPRESSHFRGAIVMRRHENKRKNVISVRREMNDFERILCRDITVESPALHVFSLAHHTSILSR